MRTMLHVWKRYHAVWDIPFETLEEAGIKLIALDRDNTTYSRKNKDIPEKVRQWVHEAKERGFKLYMISNNFHADQIAHSASILGIQKIDHAMKPLPFALRKACAAEKVTPSQAVMIGDQIFTDVASGNNAHAKTILIDALSQRDLFYTYLFRLFEYFITRNIPYAAGHDTTSS